MQPRLRAHTIFQLLVHPPVCLHHTHLLVVAAAIARFPPRFTAPENDGVRGIGPTPRTAEPLAHPQHSPHSHAMQAVAHPHPQTYHAHATSSKLPAISKGRPTNLSSPVLPRQRGHAAGCTPASRSRLETTGVGFWSAQRLRRTECPTWLATIGWPGPAMAGSLEEVHVA